jgi:hypothetical protein
VLVALRNLMLVVLNEPRSRQPPAWSTTFSPNFASGLAVN